ncbi:hypothetical protein N7533_001499 [Penicillium manginii]|uniref:uncharacterized protein n=1 Tax=Penicillium manginii TaxID=203109 RepID=UPI002546EEC3|nr:uncharacterized protein N7533_001499 [Penicillium manginii]KAJ5762818.1 hypothetical protein N7533_001499 [Penicillium manginii]
MLGSEIKHSVLDVVGNLASFYEDPLTPTGTQYDHPFLNYASTHWLQHSKAFQEGFSKTWDLWQKMIRHGHTLAQFPWAPSLLVHNLPQGEPEQRFNDDSRYFAAMGYSNARIREHHPLKWAFNHRHRALVWLIFQTSRIFRVSSQDHVIALVARSISEQDVQLLDAILSNNNFQNILDSSVFDGGTALCAAATAGYLEVTESLLAAGADVNLPLEVNGIKTALHLAAESGYSDVTACLVAAGADLDKYVEFEGDYFTALHFAAKAGHQEVVEILLRAGADVNARVFNHGKRTPLHLAVESGHLEITTRLLAAGADLNELVEIRGKTFNSLSLATLNGHRNIVQVLLPLYAERRLSSDMENDSFLLSEDED